MKKFLVPAVLLVLVLSGLLLFLRDDDQKTLTAHFERTVSVYEGSDVRVLGVPIGQVDSVEPSGTEVIVKMSYDPEVKIPETANAVIVAPSVVGDRFIQMTWLPDQIDGPEMPDGTVLPLDRTSEPLELDTIYQSLDDLVVALGPQGANKDGALDDLLLQTAKNFSGQGERFNQTIQDLSKLTKTLDSNRDELFGAARELEKFVASLAENDTTVRQFNKSLADVSALLADERDELATSLRNLAAAMDQVSTFVKTNEASLGRNIKGLNTVAKVLVKQRAALDEALTNAPVALVNLGHAGNPQAGTLDTRANLTEVLNQIGTSPGAVLCGLLNNATLCDAIEGALPRAGTFDDAARPPVQKFDPTLGGLVEVEK